LSTFEEAILSAAILMQLGHRADRLKGESYAYSLSTGRRPTEYLYEPWFLTYQRFVSKAQQVALEYGRCVIRQVDIKSFFERIVQTRLLELASQELRTTSPRIEWLLRLLLEKEIAAHEVGRGLVQGNLDSGFYANIYLTDVGVRFARPNEWDVTMLRYVDDMILIGPNSEAIYDATDALREELEKLGLELNEKKTETHSDASTFVLATTDDLLGELSTESKAVFNPIWIMDDNYREVFLAASTQQDPLWWWYSLGLYQKCLREIGIFEDLRNLSRKVDSYLRNVSRRRRELRRDTELSFPELPKREDPEILANWGLQFARENAEWVADRARLRDSAAQLVRASWSELKLPQNSGNGDRKSLRRIHFGMNKLIQLGCEDTSPLIAEILCTDPWLVRDPSWVVEGLAVQGLSRVLETILDFNANKNDATAEFVRAVTIRGLQFLSIITTSQWRKIVQYATGGSIVERLLATETWLQLGNACDGMVTDEDVSTLKASLESPEQNSRLKKNYILLLGRYDASALPPVRPDDDDIVRDAYDLIARGTASDLFDEPEPDLIRKSYYSGRAQDDRLGGPSL
jgi:hypothetical protein